MGKNKKKKNRKKGSQPVAFNYSRNQRSRITGTSPRISNREFINQVSSSTAFEDGLVEYPINPGSRETFPWLSGIAGNYEMYKFHKLKFEFVATSAADTTGTVAMAVDGDPADADPISEGQMMNYQNSVIGPVWSDKSLPIPQAILNRRKKFYVRTVDESVLDHDYDLRSSDVANLFFSAWGASITAAGRIFVEYEVQFFVPQLASPPAATGATAWDTGVSLTAPLGTDWEADAWANRFSASELLPEPISDDDFLVPYGHWLLTCVGKGTGLTNLPSVVATAPNSANLLGGVRLSSDGSQAMCEYILDVVSPAVSFALGDAAGTAMTIFKLLLSAASAFSDPDDLDDWWDEL